MTSRVTIWRKGPPSAQNETTGLRGPSWVPVAADVPFRLAGATSGESPSRTLTVGGVEIQVSVRHGDMPARFISTVRDADWLEITAGENSGRAYRVVEADGADQQTALRLPLLAETRPKEWTT